MKAVWQGQVIAESDDTVVVKDERNADAAWYYPEPKSQAEQIRDKVAFWRGVEVIS
jgi:uncharacterized protein (DUF427 family)